MAQFNAAKAYHDLRDGYIQFLLERTLGPAIPGENDPRRDYLKAYWGSQTPGEGVFARPVLEGLFRYPLCGRTVPELIRDGVLSERMRSLENPRERGFIREGQLGEDDQLYAHQLRAIEASKTKNIIVASGTGSGKTECFLYSIINNLLQDPNEDLNQPGVRVLMIYPMNALVKDQLQRIVKIVNRQQPVISVGMYTGQTPECEMSFGRQSWEMDGARRIDDQYYRRSRDVIRHNPPHILITNYSMLEYMMLRDLDKAIFGEGGSSRLKAIVLDEAHLYSGVKGNDITLLIRRTLDRFNKKLLSDDGKTTELRFYATSATIRNNTPEELRHAAGSLFGVPGETFEAITGARDYYSSTQILNWDADEQTLKRPVLDLARRVVDAREETCRGVVAVTDEELSILEQMPESAVNENGLPVLPYKLHVFTQSSNRCYSDMDLSHEDVPFGNLQQNPTFRDGIKGLEIFGTMRAEKEFYYKSLMTTGEGDVYLFSHLLGVAGVRTTFVYFRLRSAVYDVGRPGFNLERCRYTVNGRDFAVWRLQPAADGRFVFALPEFARVTVGNQHVKASDAASDGHWAFADGGRLREFAGVLSAAEEHGDDDGSDQSDVQGVAANSQTDGYRSGQSLVPLGFVPRSLRATTLTELLYPSLPEASLPREDLERLPWSGKQMLYFSDGRQNAAETAVVLQRTHQEEMIRNYLYQGLWTGFLNANADSSSFASICRRLAGDGAIMSQFSLPQMMYVGDISVERMTELKSWFLRALVFQEICIRRTGPRTLEGLGLLKVGVSDNAVPQLAGGRMQRGQMRTVYDLTNRLNGPLMTRQARWRNEVFPALVDLFRKRNKVVSCFAGDWYEFYAESRDWNLPEGQRRYKLHNRCVQNGLGYTYYRIMDNNRRLLFKSDIINEDGSVRFSEAREFLEKYFVPDNRGSFGDVVNELFKCIAFNAQPFADRGANAVFVSADYVQRTDDEGNPIAPNPHANDPTGYAFNVDCLTFSAVDPEDPSLARVRDSLYFKRYASLETFEDGDDGMPHFTRYPMLLGGLRVPEHSAQLDTDVLQKVEDQFKAKQINVLSCTPTMEVGVDIGGLSTVVQGDIPPSKASYVQRAGRAGRRNERSALTLTMTHSDVIDMHAMQDPMGIFRRTNVFAYSDITKDSAKKQVVRHLNQFLINEYYRHIMQTAGQANNPMESWDCCGNFLAGRDVMERYRTELQSLINGGRLLAR